MTADLSGERESFAEVAKTALWTAAARARESRRHDRLFDDPFAATLAGQEGVTLLSHFHPSHAADDGNPFLAIRTRWFDEFLLRSARPGCQVVGLGAGLDTRAYRLDWPETAVVFEVDQADLLSYKESRLSMIGAEPRCECRRVSVNLTDDWVGALSDNGFDPARPTIWFAEGLLFYLPESLARNVVARTAELSAPGSLFTADLIGTGIFRFPYLKPFLGKLEAAGSPWRFGTDRPGGFVQNCGWLVDKVVEPGAPAADYGRWPASVAPETLRDLPRSYLVEAAV
ncbi:SAM-dependent methyltransferase [Amycolatopsis sp. WAC 01376]|uniref:SAM-dependent methyltransferase n=1 Tax=Amycolatopsis sp. WAC 01376 TaxID=2203195 RepID=UPI000F79933A|nr:SAM-dependent methyltransferase [Amycolatopsis sp. WAC 01376]RSM56227.1 SAM-dependent methyltransferase [Amycolatopsis sp. WAC 01376]